MAEEGFLSRFAGEASVSIGMGAAALLLVKSYLNESIGDVFFFAGILAGGAVGWVVQFAIKKAIRRGDSGT